MIEFSIIIPHHNIPNLLQRCLDSIPERDDLEVIIVDDNSSTSKVDFQTFPGLNKNGVTCIFDKTGGGAGYARNIGLKCAKGKWVLFADADDYYNKEELNNFLNEYKDSSYDVIYFNAQSVNEKGDIFPKQCRVNKYFKAIQKNKSWGLEGLRYNTWEPWTKMISKSYSQKEMVCELHKRNLRVRSDSNSSL